MEDLNLDVNTSELTIDDTMLESVETYMLKSPENNIINKEKYLTVDDVRIYPESMVFNEAYDGKRFQGKLKIINSGKNVAFVRVLTPTAKVPYTNSTNII